MKNNRPAQKRRSFFHSQQAERFGIGNLGLGDASAIVLHAQGHASALKPQRRFDFRGVSMARNVGEAFLKDSEERGGGFSGKIQFGFRQPHSIA